MGRRNGATAGRRDGDGGTRARWLLTLGPSRQDRWRPFRQSRLASNNDDPVPGVGGEVADVFAEGFGHPQAGEDQQAVTAEARRLC